MARQNPSLRRNAYQNNVLRLEKYYYNKIMEVVRSEEFINDLLLIEKEIRENYQLYIDTYKIKNKLKVPAERLMRHYIYMKWHDIIEGVYPSPISSDIGIRTTDAVICIDLKTIDTVGNSNDISYTAVENNQTSFDNSNYPYIRTQSNLLSVDHYTNRPVLTYVFKIIYSDDNYSFSLSRDRYPTEVLVCIPNGELSYLFDKNIIANFKTYEYFNQTDGRYYTPIQIPDNIKKSEIQDYCRRCCVEDKHFIEVDIDGKQAFYDPRRNVLWWLTSMSKKMCIAAVKSGGSVRFNNEMLRYRFDENNRPWDGYKEFTIHKVL